ncbi:hypothetical protein [Massilia violaceinigra]|uniref:hypothetical protein n=1 Tax=Massilia violaceinigra TaxID=2045208 RepID=UPI001E464905|nr:hypothetical protein [Massilia violaceinigra]
MTCKLCRPALALALALPSAMATEIASPAGGWNRSGLVDKSDQATVAYPNSPIDRGAQSKRGMIKGRIAAAAGKREAHQRVVNGNPLRLMTDEQGHYARPYLFGAGSNSVEVKSPQGKSFRRVQFYDISSGRPLPACALSAPGTIPKPRSTCTSSRPTASTLTSATRY